MFTRLKILVLAVCVMTLALIVGFTVQNASASSKTPPIAGCTGTLVRSLGGPKLKGFIPMLGDGNVTGPGEAPPTINDISLKGSTLTANRFWKRDQVHAQAVMKIVSTTDTSSLGMARICSTYQFRIPYLPKGKLGYMGKTVEGHLSLYGGDNVFHGGLKNEAIVGWQWIVEPGHTDVGKLFIWVPGGTWQFANVTLPPDGAWHTVTMILDQQAIPNTGTVIFDGATSSSTLTVLNHPDWGPENGVIYAAEEISVGGVEEGPGGIHTTTWRKWAIEYRN